MIANTPNHPNNSGPVKTLWVNYENRHASFADLNSLSHGGNYVTAMQYFYSADPRDVVRRHLIRYDCPSGRKHTLQTEYLSPTEQGWIIDPSGSVDFEGLPPSGGDEMSSTILCNANLSSVNADYSSMGAAINTVFGMKRSGR